MTEKEAIKFFESLIPGNENAFQAIEIAIKAIKKQIPTQTTHEATIFRCHTCPTCKNVVGKFEKWGEKNVLICPKYCEICGQALDFKLE